jgi:demethylmenaquinone methyltransferase / 2-methoxy-6-polyprenyl-1,4-benzoquinol methylase
MPPENTITPPTDPAWNSALLKNPHAVPDKRQRVRKMFAAIAPSYDINNRLHSLWMDQYWRRTAVKLSNLKKDDVIIDVACGTGDLAIAFAAKHPQPKPHGILGIDFTFEMLPIAARKSQTNQKIPITWLNADAQSLPLPDACADVVSIAFGIRNVADPATAFKEFHRILKKNGRVIILEFSLPTNTILRTLYNFYFRQILPRTATLISGDRTGAYKYLPQSVNTFITRDKMQELLTTAGFSQVDQHPMTFGVCICYRGVKL